MQKNGNYIQIDKKKTISYVLSMLNEYDNNIEMKKQSESNPYKDPIYMKTDDGKFVEVPEDLQKYAISKWIEVKSMLDEKINYVNPESEEDIEKQVLEESYTMFDAIFQMILCLVIIFIILYTISLIRKGIIHL